MKIVSSLIIFALVAGNCAAAQANWGGGWTAGSFGAGHLKAIGTKQVEIMNENLNIDLYRDHARVSVEYIFHNTGSGILVKAGFPDIVYKNKNEIENYRIEADGISLASKFIKGSETTYVPLPYNLSEDWSSGKLRLNWLISHVQFSKNEEKKVKITYNSRYATTAGGISDDVDYDPETFRYLLSTGAVWKGPIRKGTITIKAVSTDPDELIFKPSGRFKRNGGIFIWKFENLKPTKKDDILIDLNDPVSIKMNYDPGDEIGLSYYSFQDMQKKYYFASHSYMASASSTLNPAKKYSAGNIKDMKRATAWCEGSAGAGTSEYLLLKLNAPARVSRIGIMPGYAKSRGTYFKNNRVAQVTAVVNDTFRGTSSFPDEFVTYDPLYPKAYRYIDISGFKDPVKRIKLIIDKTYPGTKYNDTCISEVVLQKQFRSKPDVHGAR
jgi:hypothetical protein